LEPSVIWSPVIRASSAMSLECSVWCKMCPIWLSQPITVHILSGCSMDTPIGKMTWCYIYTPYVFTDLPFVKARQIVRPRNMSAYLLLFVDQQCSSNYSSKNLYLKYLCYHICIFCAIIIVCSREEQFCWGK